MTVLHMLLQSGLYQKETYSEKAIKKYIEQVKCLRKKQDRPLCEKFVKIIQGMLTWDAS